MARTIRYPSRPGLLVALPLCAALAACFDAGDGATPLPIGGAGAGVGGSPGAGGSGGLGPDQPGRPPALNPVMRCPP